MAITDDMLHATLTCVICGKALDPALRWADRPDGMLPEPSEGTWFYSHGQYGSTVYDDFHGSYLLITICDEDVLKIAERGLVLERKPARGPHPEPETSIWLPPWQSPDQQVST